MVDLFDLEKTTISVLHKELEYKVKKLKKMKFEVMQPSINLQTTIWTLPDQSTQILYRLD